MQPFIDLAFELAKQSPTIFLLGLSVYEFRRREIESVSKLEKAQKVHSKELKETADKNTKAIKELNAEVRLHEKEHYTAIDNLTDALDKFKK